MSDPVLRNAEGLILLSKQVAREANILAYNDVFLLVGALSVIACLYGIWLHWSIWRRGEISPVIQLQKAMQAKAAAAGQVPPQGRNADKGLAEG